MIPFLVKLFKDNIAYKLAYLIKGMDAGADVRCCIHV